MTGSSCKWVGVSQFRGKNPLYQLRKTLPQQLKEEPLCFKMWALLLEWHCPVPWPGEFVRNFSAPVAVASSVEFLQLPRCIPGKGRFEFRRLIEEKSSSLFFARQKGFSINYYYLNSALCRDLSPSPQICMQGGKKDLSLLNFCPWGGVREYFLRSLYAFHPFIYSWGLLTE